jgi:hypothetical protein
MKWNRWLAYCAFWLFVPTMFCVLLQALSAVSLPMQVLLVMLHLPTRLLKIAIGILYIAAAAASAAITWYAWASLRESLREDTKDTKVPTGEEQSRE